MAEKKKRAAVSFLTAFWIACALSVNGEVPKKAGDLYKLLRAEFTGEGALPLLALLAMALFLGQEGIRRGRGLSARLAALVFALCTCLGLSFNNNGSLAFFFASPAQFALFVFTLLGYFFLYEAALSFAYGWLGERLSGFSLERGGVSAGGEREGAGKEAETARERDWEKREECRVFLRGAGFLLLCWLPFLVVFWPGSLTRDAYRSLNMGFGIWPLTGHQPWVISMFFTALVRFGRQWGDNAGIFVTVLVLCLIQALSYAQVGRFFVRWGLPSWARKAALCFYGFLPIFGSYAQALIKDGLNAALYTLMAGHYLDYVLSVRRGSFRSRGEKIRKLLLIAVFGVLCTYARRNGIFPVMAMAVLLPVLLPKGERRPVPALIVLLAAGYLLHTAAGQVIGVEKASPRVYFSIPFQQTARYLRDYPEDVTGEELAVIDKLVDAKALPELYTPESSDPVKNSFRGGIGMDAVFAYLRVWWRMFLRHPLVYFEATLHNSFGYYDPFSYRTVNKPFYLTMAGGVYDTGFFHFSYGFPDGVRQVLYRYCFLWQKIPLLAQLVNTGFYTWLYLFLLGFIGYERRFRQWAAFGGFAVLLAIFTASPINGCVRYFLPLISSAPLFVTWALGAGKETEERWERDGEQ